MSTTPADPDKLRFDKWLWAARFFKTRSVASAAIEGGHAHLNGARVKPAHPIRIDDRVDITRGQERLTVRVVALSDRRGPAPVAQTLYEETPESLARRATPTAAPVESGRRGGRPTKQDRRRIDRYRHGDGE
ncbi:RNA-binding S4 domain-containing protein [Nitrogeniibacter mangrovi]|uniref:RNA-binding S4 domain-containing protein n=1 Tax=Nitrogeniibacter mangrovi TaxID=2016596 RepID=A0A6C1B896_9RHOO|nr:RNA-binding S4 domain-containing protein [Nitrogeniibacter mangrovi]QID19035.1 RNA-binding S4 domain-containing protein [Nitrogeniibacter mangrovi]